MASSLDIALTDCSACLDSADSAKAPCCFKPSTHLLAAMEPSTPCGCFPRELVDAQITDAWDTVENGMVTTYWVIYISIKDRHATVIQGSKVELSQPTPRGRRFRALWEMAVKKFPQLDPEGAEGCVEEIQFLKHIARADMS